MMYAEVGIQFSQIASARYSSRSLVASLSTASRVYARGIRNAYVQN